MGITRKIQIDIDTVYGRGYRTHAEFEDFHHHIILDMLFELSTGKILEVEVKLIKYPFPECPMAIESIKSLLGFKGIDFGVRKEIFKMVAGPSGCTHLAELVMESINTCFQAGDVLIPDWEDPDLMNQRRESWENAWANSCIHYKLSEDHSSPRKDK